MSDSLKNNTEAQETEYAVKPTKRARAKRHCLRFWWAYLIALICIIVLVVCLM
jgi:t-SNARE complex subunit (syntaxin)